MKAELESSTVEKTTQLLEWITNTVKTTTDFTAEQVPLFVQELLTYNFYMSLAGCIVGILMTLISIGIIVSGRLKDPNDVNDATQMIIRFVTLIVCGTFIISGPTIALSNTEWVKIKIAPRVFLVDYVLKNLKANKQHEN